MELQGVSAVVTGGASGLGLATVRRLLERGAKVTVVDREPDRPGLGLDGRARLVTADVTAAGDVERAIEAARADGPVRVLVHCAGRGSDRLRIVDRSHAAGDLDVFAEVVHTNLVGTYNVLRLVAAEMSRNEPVGGCRGACVLTSSIAAFEGQIGQTSYSASKAGVHAMTLVAARDLARYGIRVNTIAPGTFDTAMLGRLRPELRADLVSAIPYPARLGDPAEFGRMAVGVLENDYLNGETIRLDGAMRMAAR
ncbi:SDR family NAD(P)-dependent oxidoreductase [Actinomadura rugatobispora]|uniref:SDR family NAD(P)-dependent oxidoreductase n=1 Tax=Actinomadura rugatobispora TaxID=1994 RepID=A0ABW1ABD6_9ACTN|nr:SDR family NAD(P)-dependent oxidoreductase [Actinomadura rugatobispora]